MRKLSLSGLVVSAIFCMIMLGYQADYEYNTSIQLGTLFDPTRAMKEGCECQGENFCFHGLNESLQRKYGQPFPCEHYKYLKEFHLTQSDISALKTNGTDEIDDNWRPVFASAVSSNHFPEMRSFVLDIRKRVPNSKIIIYDLGLDQKQIDEMTSWCHVEYRKFEYANYPPHFRNLLNYAFKIVIAEILRTERNFFFYDSSVRLKDNLHKMIPKAIKDGKVLPFMNFNAAWHSVYATLVNGTLDYIPLPNEVLYAKEYQSILFISDSVYTRRFIRWFSLCALTEDCISPKGAIVNCTENSDPVRGKMHCHRYDQNLWNMIHLGYLFDPVQRGALSLGLVDKWGNGKNFIRNVLKKRDDRYLWWGNKFLVVRAGSQTPVKVECPEQIKLSTIK